MIVYRAQASSGESWVTEWFARLDQAKRAAKLLTQAGYTDPHVDRIAIGGGREELVEALNHADASRINWDGEPVTL